MQIKKATTINEQIKILLNHNCKISNMEECKSKLSSIGYYRLSAYFNPFKQSDGNFKENTDFKDIYSLFEFDKKLRNLLIYVLEDIEITLRATIFNHHAIKYGTLGYLNENNFNNHHNHHNFLEMLNKSIFKHRNVNFISHYINKYDRQFPLWVISEIFTFGSLSYFYSDLKLADKKTISKQFNLYHEDLKSWLRCCTDLRNICAHYNRLYNRRFSAVPRSIDTNNENVRKLWSYIIMIKNLYPYKSQWKTIHVKSFEKLFNSYKNVIDLNRIGFPDDWITKISN